MFTEGTADVATHRPTQTHTHRDRPPPYPSHTVRHTVRKNELRLLFLLNLFCITWFLLFVCIISNSIHAHAHTPLTMKSFFPQNNGNTSAWDVTQKLEKKIQKCFQKSKSNPITAYPFSARTIKNSWECTKSLYSHLIIFWNKSRKIQNSQLKASWSIQHSLKRLGLGSTHGLKAPGAAKPTCDPLRTA